MLAGYEKQDQEMAMPFIWISPTEIQNYACPKTFDIS